MSLSSRGKSAGDRNDGLVRRVVHFSGVLRRHGFNVFPSTVAEAVRALDALDITCREDVFHGLRATLVHSDLEWRLFPELFDTFWSDASLFGYPDQPGQGEGLKETPLGDAVFRELPVGGPIASGDEEDIERFEEQVTRQGAIYSPVPSFETQTFERLRPEDLRFARLALKNMITPFRFAASRRRRPSRKPRHMDFRRTVRESMKSEGIPLRVHYRRKRKRLRRLVLLADVSGSMDRYARFVLPFLMGIKGSGVRSEVFVFSTTLTPISSILRRYDVDDALDRISQATPDWSGGTRIGYSLSQFNRDFCDRLVNLRTVVVILSDGWDLGAKAMLAREMATLRRKARRVIWLNPVAGDSEGLPLFKGMYTVLPYVHHHLPVSSLRRLNRAGHILASELRES